jgi:hypothetical protein
MTTWFSTLEGLKKEFPKFRVVIKDESKLMKFFAFFLNPFNPRFMDQFTVTLGQTIYMPRWMVGKDFAVEVLRHEAVHIRDSKKWGLLYYISYCILPIGPSFRAYWEFRGYSESIKVEFEQKGFVSSQSMEFFAKQFTGPNYLFMFPFPKTIRKMLGRVKSKVLTDGTVHFPQ